MLSNISIQCLRHNFRRETGHTAVTWQHGNVRLELMARLLWVLDTRNLRAADIMATNCNERHRWLMRLLISTLYHSTLVGQLPDSCQTSLRPGVLQRMLQKKLIT